ncbi:hypothetical protein GY45DRAFT_207245 [Cubamyces sp. BRFM 1775]|nr:hypothetical protein GY45DRAFT_207245 [Cubamyces sp. BRFM 1775]
MMGSASTTPSIATAFAAMLGIGRQPSHLSRRLQSGQDGVAKAVAFQEQICLTRKQRTLLWCFHCPGTHGGRCPLPHCRCPSRRTVMITVDWPHTRSSSSPLALCSDEIYRMVANISVVRHHPTHELGAGCRPGQC